jgi:hypothetical protein
LKFIGKAHNLKHRAITVEAENDIPKLVAGVASEEQDWGRMDFTILFCILLYQLNIYHEQALFV